MNSTNVSLRLTSDEAKLAVLRERGALRVPKNGKDETFYVKFDSQTFPFTPGKIIVVPHNVAEGLINYRPLMGGSPTKAKWAGVEHEFLSALDADWTQVIDVVETWPVGEEAPSAKRVKATTCGVCGNDLGSIAALRVHLADHEEDLAAVKG